VQERGRCCCGWGSAHLKQPYLNSSTGRGVGRLAQLLLVASSPPTGWYCRTLSAVTLRAPSIGNSSKAIARGHQGDPPVKIHHRGGHSQTVSGQLQAIRSFFSMHGMSMASRAPMPVDTGLIPLLLCCLLAQWMAWMLLSEVPPAVDGSQLGSQLAGTVDTGHVLLSKPSCACLLLQLQQLFWHCRHCPPTDLHLHDQRVLEALTGLHNQCAGPVLSTWQSSVLAS
jgi:hypothetical protein